MTLPLSAIEASAGLLAQLVNPAVRAVALSVAVAAGLAAFRVKATSARLFTRTAVLYAALAMPLLGWMLPPVSVPVPTWVGQSAWAFNRLRPTRVDAPTVQTPSESAEPPSEAEVVALRAEIVKAPRAEAFSGYVATPDFAPAFREKPVAVSEFPTSQPWWLSIPWTAVAVMF